MDSRIYLFSLLLFLSMNLQYKVQHVSAQDVMAFGEMRSQGDVYIRSSTGNWLPAPSPYPILENTVINTGKGSVSLYYKDGSRIDVSESTTASFSSAVSGNTVHITQGQLAVNTNPGSSFIFSNGSGDIIVKRSHDQGGRNFTERFVGIVSSDQKGVGVQSISGTASLMVKGSTAKEIPSGHGISVGADNQYIMHKNTARNIESRKCDKYKKPKKNASPSAFDDISYHCYND